MGWREHPNGEDANMSELFVRRRERQLLRAGLTFRKGRSRVLWLHGVLYFGGTLFLLYNAVDYLIEPAARPTSVETAWFFAALILCGLAGYIYGFFMWRCLERTFGGR
jgi:uncharacterized membrane protein